MTCSAENPALAPGESTAITLAVAVAYAATPGVENCVAVATNGDINLANNSACHFRDVSRAEMQFDLGDAPDSSNHIGRADTLQYEPPTEEDDHDYEEGHSHFNFEMYTYDGNVLAQFPTVYDPEAGAISGPIHWESQADAWLGAAVSLETDADIGPDEDEVTNIEPISNTDDQDGHDDGVRLETLDLPDCGMTDFDYDVTIVGGAQTRYINVWFDFNRDGDWDDILECQQAGQTLQVPESAVQNHGIMVGNGSSTLTTPQFAALNPSSAPVWMRITLSDQLAPTEGDGRGPAGGYLSGETEDYYLQTPLRPRL